MIQNINTSVEVFTLNELADVKPAVDAFIGGKIILFQSEMLPLG